MSSHIAKHGLGLRMYFSIERLGNLKSGTTSAQLYIVGITSPWTRV